MPNSTWKFRRWLYIALSSSMLFSSGSWVAAEVVSLKLPVDASDFAMNPDAGDLVALDAERNRAMLFRRDELDRAKATPAVETNVGPTPVSVCFKKYKDQSYFAVVCTQDAHLFLLDAGTLALKKKIPIAASGVSQVTASTNLEDPYVYYNYGSGHDSKAGVVDLRALADRGPVFDQSMDCAISANGMYAYRRGPWSPSGFEALICTNGQQGEKPLFTSVHREHTSTAAYVPDPHNQYTAAGNGLFSVILDKRVAGFDFTPLAFASQRPLIFGIAGQDPSRLERRNPSTRTLVAASYNSFTKIGESIPLPAPEAKESPLPRGVPSQADFKQVGRRSRLIVDDARSRLLFAERTQVLLIPWKDLQLPDEPLMIARLENTQDLNVGESHRLKVLLADPRVQMEADLLPDGATFKDSVVTWQPTPDQLGETAFEITLKHGDLQKNARLIVQVVTPSIKLPFMAGSVTMDDTDGPLIVSIASANPRNYRPSGATVPVSTSQLAAIDTSSRKILATAAVSRPLRTVTVAQELVLLTFNDDPSTIDIYDRAQLKRLKSIIASGPINRVRVQDDVVVLTSNQLVEVFDKSTWKRRQLFTPSNPAANLLGSNLADSAHGVLVDGVLRNFRGEPLLVAAPFDLPTMGQIDGRVMTTLFGLEESNRFEAARAQPAAVPIPGTSLTANIAFTARGMSNPNRSIGELSLLIGGQETDRILLARAPLPAQPTPEATVPPPALGVSRGMVAVVHGNQLYLWKPPAKEPEATPTSLEWTARQSTFALLETEPTVLKHEIRGGRPPYQFVLQTPMEGLSLDEKSGDIRAEWSAMRPFVESQLVQPNAAVRQAQEVLQTESQRQRLATELKRRLNVDTKGLPVAIPIRVRVSDADDRSLTLQYLVLADVPVQSLQERLQAMAPRSLPKPAAETVAVGEKNSESSSIKAELDRLNTRLDKLENRLDLIIKLLSKTDEKQ